MLSSLDIFVETDLSRIENPLSRNKQSQQRIFLLPVLLATKDIFDVALRQVILIIHTGRDPQHEKSLRKMTTRICSPLLFPGTKLQFKSHSNMRPACRHTDTRTHRYACAHGACLAVSRKYL